MVKVVFNHSCDSLANTSNRSTAPHRQREVEMRTISFIVVVILLPNSGGG
jgi:hypothetical protein